MEIMDNPLGDILATAIRFGAPEYYLASVAFQLEVNNCANLAKKIIDAAKSRYPAFPFENIPALAQEDREAFEAGNDPKDIIAKRNTAIFQTFNV
jgi:hypothetical protein